eukprot:CAMPEP_0202959382 /NCGR_PEP_ID=MMETSP1396-20130829/3576_1 /ASSEMBLY_ACC=CAM_ASM_000872 /TAXON_ID= /ORGANISM="Pseudokeronopsis sp., Strain Brazil" /LENGTH=78 /DNA_ID=CAMNT_0049677905 /DNA_START=224 /DNA_END=460 /DNA_ORIENTATION=+
MDDIVVWKIYDKKLIKKIFIGEAKMVARDLCYDMSKFQKITVFQEMKDTGEIECWVKYGAKPEGNGNVTEGGEPVVEA